ncbi:chromodomain-helicase-DNA-binding protein Mi-2 homolog [Homarus americanus]|uniref:chromodomain-helicase-DNA-binding protein Mi-2 homolog n=1 Tax=Homarus americanus TaxID=6706 RepID=UPI001C48AB57|nr:chromodomain-helicase-DNA-binding protein Mi-2 homolog [Homarus americanus]
MPSDIEEQEYPEEEEQEAEGEEGEEEQGDSNEEEQDEEWGGKRKRKKSKKRKSSRGERGRKKRKKKDESESEGNMKKMASTQTTRRRAEVRRGRSVRELWPKRRQLEYTENDYQTLTTYKLFQQHVRPLLAKENPRSKKLVDDFAEMLSFDLYALMV